MRSDPATRRSINGSETKYSGCHLRRKYFEKKPKGLQNTNPHNWWRVVKEITGLQQKSTEPLVGRAQRLHDGDVHKLADHINSFFQQVAADVRPLSDPTTLSSTSVVLSEFVIDQSAVERKLSQISVHKAPGPDDLPNWILRDFCSQLSGPVCAIFNASIREGTVPARCQCDSSAESQSTSTDRNRSASDLADCNFEQIARIVRWRMDTE